MIKNVHFNVDIYRRCLLGHKGYLEKMGFVKENSVYVKNA